MSTIRFAWSISKPSTQILGTSFYVNHQIRLVHFETINSNPWNFILCQPSDSVGPFRNHQLKSLELHSMSTVRFAWSISKPSTQILGTSFYVNHQIRLVHFETINSNPWNFIVCQPSDLLGPFRNHQLKSLELHSMSTIRFAWSILKPSTQILGTSFYVNHQIRLVHFETINSNPWNFIVCQPSDSLGPFRNHQLKSLELHCMSNIRFGWSISKPSTQILGTSLYVNHQIRLVHFETINSNPWNFIVCQPSDSLGPFRNHQLKSLELHSMSTIRFAWSILKPSTGILGTFSMLTIIFAWSISKPSTQIL